MGSMGPLDPGLWLLLGVLIGAASGLHSLRFLRVIVTEPSPGMPQYTEVGYLDGHPIMSYDSETERMESQADWMAANLDQHFWDIRTQIVKRYLHFDLMSLNKLHHHYNRSGTIHTLQHVFGCDLLEDGSTRRYRRYAYEGKDFINFDIGRMMFSAVDAVGEISKRKWENKAASEECKIYLETDCIEELRRFMSYGQDVLERKEPPTVRVSGMEAHGILTLRCRTYGFYPRLIRVSWLKDGEVRDQDTEWGSILPNGDGTYYTQASIKARPEDKDKYRCRVEHASLAEPGLFALEPKSTLLALVLWVVVAILVVVAALAGFVFWKMQQDERAKRARGYNVASTGIST